MKICSPIAVMILALAVPASAGTICGTVRAERYPGATNDATCADPYKQSRALKFAEVKDYSIEHEFVVFILGPVGGKPVPPDQPTRVVTERIAQRGAAFSPHILPVVVGTTVEWPNYDQIFHNVFSMSDPKSFDLLLYKGSPPEKRVTFDKPGRVDVFCSIHSAMSCVVLVMENPYFASTDGKGRYRISNVPPGTYKLKAWYERLPADIKEVAVPESGEVKVDFVLTVKNLPKI